MHWLNYNHLLYFWTVVREGSVTNASKCLHVTQSTIRGQIHALEESLGHKLFRKSGRNLALTDVGRLVYQYADEIFAVGQDLKDALDGRRGARERQLVVGIADAVPKFVAHRVLEPVLTSADPVRLMCRFDKPDRLLTDLGLHHLDIVLADSPLTPALDIRAYNHLLGESRVTFFGAARFAVLRRGFPKSLQGRPFLLPLKGTTLRQSLDRWFEEQRIQPRIVGEFEESELLRTFGETAIGLFAAPTVIRAAVCEHYKVEPVGELEGISERFYVISVERRINNAAVLAIMRHARVALASEPQRSSFGANDRSEGTNQIFPAAAPRQLQQPRSRRQRRAPRPTRRRE